MEVSFAELEISGDFEAGPWRERGLIRLFLGFFVIASRLCGSFIPRLATGRN